MSEKSAGEAMRDSLNFRRPRDGWPTLLRLPAQAASPSLHPGGGS